MQCKFFHHNSTWKLLKLAGLCKYKYISQDMEVFSLYYQSNFVNKSPLWTVLSANKSYL